MKAGDIIEICPPEPFFGALQAVKFFAKLKDRTAGLTGIIIKDHGDAVSALFGENIVTIHKRYTKVLDNRAKT
jgi:hypothetical protein|tara:strand:- start:426 stop:644 length:219 start_codon:yes stop_codon:yes gene_type:complete